MPFFSALRPFCWQLALLVAATLAVSVRALALEVPPLEARVMDQAGLLDAERRKALEAELAAHERQTGHQLAVLTIKSLEGEPIEDYSMRVVEAWKLGHAKEDNGLLLLVAIADRKVRIEVGYGLEGEVPDALAGRIIRNVITPSFRSGDFAGGIERAMRALMQASAGKKVDLPERGATSAPKTSALWPLLMFVLMFLVLPLLARRGGLGGFIMLGGLGGGFGRGHGGFGGGGGFSGGGGGFGGGGASGNW